MMIDYSKWKNIEVSDDEDETHPNIDTPSLFRWRHQARIERMAEIEKEKEALKVAKEQNEIKRRELAINVQKAGNEAPKSGSDLALKQLENEFQKLQNKEAEIEKKEKLMPWNVDTISKEGWSKTVINKPKKLDDRSNLSEEERENLYKKFVDENESKIQHLGMLSKWDDCKLYLLEHPHLCCDDTANYLAIWCLNLEIEEKHELMEHVSKQVVAMQYILELAKQLDCDPRSCISTFFSRIQTADKPYQDAFEEELNSFKQRIRDRARARIEKALAEVEEEEKQKRLGPGGLDPVEVFETLPKTMQECFENRDIGQLQNVIAELEEAEARYHMKRCVDSGLWIPDAKAADEKEKLHNEANEKQEESLKTVN